MEPPPPPPPPFSNASSKRILRSNNVAKQVERTKPPKNSRKASFIKLLGVDFSQQLKIPDDFVTVFNGRVPLRFIIESDMTKECWRVEVEEDEGVYLRDGWVEFVEAHHLKVGDFLLFEYEEQSIFLVKVFNRDGCQKTVISAQGDKNNPLKINDLEEQDDSEPFESLTKIRRTDRSCKKQRKRSFTGGKTQQTTPRKNARVATESLTEHSMSFSVKIDKHMSYQLTVPMAISKAKLVHKKGVTLENAIGDHWPVKLSHKKDGRVRLTRGWKKFWSDNSVAAGDSLRFEFITDDVLKVLVTKALQVERKSEEPNSPNGATAATPSMDDCEFDEVDVHTAHVILAEASNTAKKSRKRCSPVLNSTSFTFLWGPTTPASFLTLPRISVARTKLSDDETVVLKDQDGRTWPLKLRKMPAGRVDLAHGWKEFLIENNIKSGDILTFEDNVINIHIERSSRNDVPPEMATKSEPMDSFDGNHDLCEEPVVNYTTANHNATATETETTKLKTERVFFDNFMPSSFSVTWKHSVFTSYYLHIPRPIARTQKLKNNDTMVIQDPEGKQWRMEIRIWPSDGRVVLTKGWDTFLKRHKISIGDTLVCEFVSDHIMKVNIVRLSPSYASCRVEPAMKREVMQLD